MGYQYDRQRCSNAAPARVESLRAAVSTTDQWVVAKTSGNFLEAELAFPVSQGGIRRTLWKTGGRIQEIAASPGVKHSKRKVQPPGSPAPAIAPGKWPVPFEPPRKHKPADHAGPGSVRSCRTGGCALPPHPVLRTTLSLRARERGSAWVSAPIRVIRKAPSKAWWLLLTATCEPW